jgi:hypothetical protein
MKPEINLKDRVTARWVADDLEMSVEGTVVNIEKNAITIKRDDPFANVSVFHRWQVRRLVKKPSREFWVTKCPIHIPILFLDASKQIRHACCSLCKIIHAKEIKAKK